MLFIFNGSFEGYVNGCSVNAVHTDGLEIMRRGLGAGVSTRITLSAANYQYTSETGITIYLVLRQNTQSAF
jgi:hypothetical protein